MDQSFVRTNVTGQLDWNTIRIFSVSKTLVSSFNYWFSTQFFLCLFLSNKIDWLVLLKPNYYSTACFFSGFLILCTIITIAYFTHSLFMYKSYKIQLESSPDAANFLMLDGYLLQSNSFVYLISIAMWLPMVNNLVLISPKPILNSTLLPLK